MNYQPILARQHRTAAELKAAYKVSRGKFFDDPETIAALRSALGRAQSAHRADVDRLTADLANARAEIYELKSRLVAAVVHQPVALPAFIDKKKYAFKRVLTLICRAHGIGEDEIASLSRGYDVSRARMHLIDVLATHRPDLSGSRVGRLLNRDHSTVSTARNRWQHVKHLVPWAVAEFERLIAVEPEAE
jgi:chromosomal replication initiation ATPase DnaA